MKLRIYKTSNLLRRAGTALELDKLPHWDPQPRGETACPDERTSTADDEDDDDDDVVVVVGVSCVVRRVLRRRRRPSSAKTKR